MGIIQINKKNYAYYEYINADDGLAEEINNELDYLRRVLKGADDEIGLKDVSYRLGIYEEAEIDAVVTKEDSVYFMGISNGAFEKLRNWFNMFFLYEKTYKAFGLKRENRDYYTRYTYRKALEFLVLHEYVHMKDGHLDIPNNKQKLVYEQSKIISKEEALFSQTTEFISDIWAAAYCTEKIVEEKISAEEKNEKLKLLTFSIYTIFKKFSEYDKYDFERFMEDDLLKYTHPMVWIRYRYIIVTILANIPDAPKEYRKTLEKDLVDGIMNFESQVLNINDLTEKMFALAHTQKGTKHLIILNNSWNEVADMLEGYAHVELTRVIPLGKEAEELVIVDDNGNMIK